MDQTRDSSRPRKRPPPRTAWPKGVSGNPKGRPGRLSSLTDAIVASVSTDELVAIALDLARNGRAESTRIAALCWLRDSGYTRPAERHELSVGAASDDDDDLDGLSLDQLAELETIEHRRIAILAAPRSDADKDPAPSADITSDLAVLSHDGVTRP